ncbi:MAG: hypothetical protein R3F29_04970 [Planctomycetota bacterium]
MGQPALQWTPAIVETQQDRAPRDLRSDLGSTAWSLVAIPDHRFKALAWRGLVLNNDRHETIVRGDDPPLGLAINLDCP